MTDSLMVHIGNKGTTYGVRRQHVITEFLMILPSQPLLKLCVVILASQLVADVP